MRARYGDGRIFQKRPGGPFYVRVSINGERKEVSSRSTKKADAVKLKQQLLAGETNSLDLLNCRKVTVEEIVEDYIREATVRRCASVNVMKLHKRWAMEYGLRNMPACKVTTARLLGVMQAMQREGYGDSSVNRVMTTLKTAFRLATSSTPKKLVSMPTFPAKLSEDYNIRKTFFEPHEVEALLLHIKDPAVRDFVDWSSWTGQRKGEVSKLTWAMVDWDKGNINVPGSITKNGKDRKLPFGEIEELGVILQRRQDARKDRMAQGLPCPNLIFWRIHTGRVRPRCKPGDAVPIYEFRKSFDSACAAAGLVGKRWPHDLRRSAVRLAWEATKDRKIAMALSGHKTEATFERYNIKSDAQVRKGMQDVGQLGRAKRSATK